MNRRKPALRFAGAITSGAFALLTTGAWAQAKAPDLSGTWFPDFLTNEFGPPVTGRNTPWVPLSGGDPRQMKIPTAAEQNKQVSARMAVEHGKAPAPATPSVGGGGASRNSAQLEAVLNDAGKAARSQLKAGEGLCYAPNNVFGKIGSAAMVVQGKDRIVVSFDGYGPPRVIYLDGRTDENALPSWNGFSVGKWVGGALVVKTTNIKGDSVQGNMPKSSSATLVEEIRLTANGKMLQVFATFEDAEFYKEPFRKMVYLDLKTSDNELVDSHCLEGLEDQIDTITGKPAH